MVVTPPLAVAVRASWSVMAPCLAVFVCTSRSLVSKDPSPGLSSGVLANVTGTLLPASAGDAFIRVGVDIPIVAYVCLCVSGTNPRW